MWDWLKGFWDKKKSILQEAAKTEIGIMAESIQEIAIQAVADGFNYTGLSGRGKQAKAFNRIEREAKKQGLNVASASINLAIETAVAILTK